MKIGAAYVRVSTDDQLEYSPDSQLKTIIDYAKREGYVIPEEYIYREEDGISGKSADKRPAFRLMIATAKQEDPPFDSIFVWKYSRFARNQEEAIMYKNLLKKKGIAVKSISEPSNDSPFSSLIERIIEWMDEYYLINLASEVQRGKIEKASRGEYSGRPPFGYDLVNKKLVPNKDAEVVRYIFDRYLTGDTIREIAMTLPAHGVNVKTGARFVRYVLSNPAYIGKVRYSKEGRIDYLYGKYDKDGIVFVDGIHEPIIDNDTWERTQRKLASFTIKYVRPEHPEGFMLKGLLRCGNCGATLIQSNAQRKSLQCHRYNRGNCSVSHSILISKANEAVMNGLSECIGNNSFTFSPDYSPQNKDTTDWDKLIRTEETKLDRAREAYISGVFTIDEYKSSKAEIDRVIEQIKVKKQEKRDFSHENGMEKVKEKTISVMKILESPDVSEMAKNEALRTIIDKIVYNKTDNTFDIYFKPQEVSIS